MKNQPKSGRSARRGNQQAPYTTGGKSPYRYPWERRTASGELHTKANDRVTNKYP